MKNESVELPRKSGAWTVNACTRGGILSAVPRQLQLNFQDTKIAVTNWDRIRLNPTPNYSV